MINKTQPLVTIGIPTYNRANGYLKHALQSAVGQTYQNIEIVVSDNCSADNTEMVVKNFHDPRIKYFRQNENIGANNNFNFCLEQANGIYFLLLLDDDLIDCDFIEKCINAVNGNINAGIILTGTREINATGKILTECPNRGEGLSAKDFFLSWFAGYLPLYLCSTLFNTGKLMEIGGFQSKTNHYQDVVAEVKLVAKYGKVDVYDVKASFRRHNYNMGALSKVSDWCEDSLYLLDIMCNFVPDAEALIRSKGLVYFCLRNYRRASNIKSPFKRFSSYFFIYKKFNYCRSPINFIYRRSVRPQINAFKRKIKQAFFCGIDS